MQNIIDNKLNAKPLVAIFMVTYNHEKFIAEAINGVMMQKTAFNYLLVIGDDCSTDSTLETCSEFKNKYPDKILLLKNARNMGAFLNAQNIYKECYNSGTKYVAMCEGDDYWTDKDKLQKQVNFLESNQKLVGCFSDALTINPDGKILGKTLFDENKKEVSIAEIGSFWMPTLTICFRSMYLKTIINSRRFRKVNNGDMFLYYILSQFGNFGYVQTYPSYYRMHPGGIWSGLKVINQYEKNQVSNYIIYDELLPEFKHVLIGRIMENFTWQLNYLRDIEHITYVFKCLRNNLPELFKRKLFRESSHLMVLTFPVFIHRVNLRLKRIFRH